MSDKIAEIRKRHEDVAWRYIELPVIYEDRAFLLAEVEKQRAEIEWLTEALNEAMKEKNWLEKELADCLQLCDYLAGADR